MPRPISGRRSKPRSQQQKPPKTAWPRARPRMLRRAAEARVRAPLQSAEREAQRRETEAKTLSNLLSAPTGGSWTAVVDEIAAAKGFEAALGAALGDDLDAATDAAAPAHWALTSAQDDPALPDSVEPLAKHVTAPAALARRLAQIGVVAKSDGGALRALLRPGQRCRC